MVGYADSAQLIDDAVVKVEGIMFGVLIWGIGIGFFFATVGYCISEAVGHPMTMRGWCGISAVVSILAIAVMVWMQFDVAHSGAGDVPGWLDREAAGKK